MRTSSFLLVLFLIVGHLLPLTLASLLDSGGASYQNTKRQCRLWRCKFDMPGVIGTWTPSPSFHQVSQTATALSAPTPVNPQVATDPGQGSGSGSHLSSANAGVALVSHGTVLMALSGLLATVLVF